MTIQILKDLLRAYILEFEGYWEDNLPLVEFTYNNTYYATIGMAPYEALHWDEIGERKLLGPELVQIITNKVRVIREKIKEA
jgi:hypothetical protein